MKTLLEALRTDDLEVSDQLILRSLGRWCCERDTKKAIISHELSDHLTNKLFRIEPRRRLLTSPTEAPPPTGCYQRGIDHIGATNVATVPLSVDRQTVHPSQHSALVRQHWTMPTHMLLLHSSRLSLEKRTDQQRRHPTSRHG